MTTSIVDFRSVSYVYPRSQRPALEGVTLSVSEGEVLAIVGPNGAGKSTLMALLIGLLRPCSGSIKVGGLRPSQARRRGLVGCVPQRLGAELRFPVSARQVVLMSASRGVTGWRRTPASVRTNVDAAMERVGALDVADEPVGRLSRGQLQRILIARALAAGARILALDEPLVGIDAPGRQQFAALLDEIHRDLGLTILLVSHDLRTIASGGARCDRVACLNRVLHFHDAPQGITPAVLAEVFQHDLADVFGDVHVDAHRGDQCMVDHPHAGAMPEHQGEVDAHD